MKFTYSQSSGKFSLNNSVLGQGYSGFGAGRNNPAMEELADTGPIPRGMWKIVKPAYDDPHLGPIVMHLEPVGHDAHGRTLFRIHGDNKTGDASHGCIILAHGVRQLIASSDIQSLEVVS